MGRLHIQRLGFTDRVAQADSVNKFLRKVTFDADTIEVALAIRDALHPVTGKREEYFVGLSDGGLKRLLKTRFIELKKKREQAFSRAAVLAADALPVTGQMIWCSTMLVAFGRY